VIRNKKIILYILFLLGWTNILSAEMIVLKNCFEKELDAYGKPIDFNQYKENINKELVSEKEEPDFVDWVIRVDTKKKEILDQNVYSTDHVVTGKYKILEKVNNTFIGVHDNKKSYNSYIYRMSRRFNIGYQDVEKKLGELFMYVDLDKSNAKVIFANNIKKAIFESEIECSGMGNSTLKSILKLLR
tara:strand:+ start:481 stop:1041 length:561 start_codon:yes stop_codon:yes gene_type:complete